MKDRIRTIKNLCPIYLICLLTLIYAGCRGSGSDAIISPTSSQTQTIQCTDVSPNLTIDGIGLFILREPNSDRPFYSPEGFFFLDTDGYLVNDGGFVLQGWELDDDGQSIGSISDIRLQSFTLPPDETDHLAIITNLDLNSSSNTVWMANAWDASNDPPLATTNYEYQATVKVYDALGSSHDITVYYDRASNTDSIWEYIVTCNPSEDARSFITGPNDSNAGLLARGLVSFSDSSGTTLPDGLTMETLSATGDHIQEAANLSFIGVANGFSTENTSININDHNSLTFSDTGITLTRSAGGVWSLSGIDPAGDYAAAEIFPGPLSVSQTAGAANDVSDTYTFTVTSGGTVGVNTIDISWVSTADTTGGTFTVPLAGVVAADGMTLTFAAGRLSTGDTFTMTTDATGAATVASVPADSGFSISLDGTATTAADCEMSIAFASPITGAGTVTFDLTGSTNWTPATPNVSGYYEFAPDFIGASDGSSVMGIEFDIGTVWDGAGFQNDSMTTTQFARSSTVTFQSANGYGAGGLQSIDVDSDGIMNGSYSGGQIIHHSRIALAMFLNNRGLNEVCESFYQETRDSGEAITGCPNTDSFGSISPKDLWPSDLP